MCGMDLMEKLDQCDMVLVGLGEEFDGKARLRQIPEYVKGCGILEKEGLKWLIPFWNELCSEKLGESLLEQSLARLTTLLENKNYFVVSVSTNSRIAHHPWKNGRLVMPCGTVLRKQCGDGCRDVLSEVTETEREELRERLIRMGERDSFQDISGRYEAGSGGGQGEKLLGICPKCGMPLVLNNVYAKAYNEDGYLERWRLYTKWLQGTLNHRLLVLELGVGMDFPSVVRWPFEKVTFFNQKAFLCRVNEKLYQLTEELAEKGCGISQNAIDWLSRL